MARPKSLTKTVNEVIAQATHLTPLDSAGVRQLQMVAKKLESMYADPDWDPKGDSYNHLFLKLLNELKLTPNSRGVVIAPKEDEDDLATFRAKKSGSK